MSFVYRDNKNRTMHGCRGPVNTIENGSGSNGCYAELGGEQEEDIGPETLEVVLYEARSVSFITFTF